MLCLHDPDALSSDMHGWDLPRVTQLTQLSCEIDIDKAKALLEERHGEQKRQNGSPYCEHPEEVARITEEIVQSGWRGMAVTAAYLHDITEDNPDIEVQRPEIPGRSNDRVLYLSDIFNSRVCRIVELLQNRSRTYQDYVEKLLKIRNKENRELSIIAIIIKFADRIANTPEKEELDEDICRSEFRSKAGASQEDLLDYYEKKKDVLFITADAEGRPIQWYDENQRLIYDEDLFVRASVQRFRIKRFTNAIDNLAIFLPKIEEVLCRNPQGGGLFDFNKLWERTWDLYVRSLKILKTEGRMGVERLQMFTHKSQTEQVLKVRGQREGRLTILAQLELLSRAARENREGLNGEIIAENDLRKPHPPMSVSEMEALLEGFNNLDHKIMSSRGHRVIKAMPEPLKALKSWDGNEPITVYAENLARAIHGEALRESGQPETEHLSNVVARVDRIIDSQLHKPAALAVAWLHDALAHRGSQLAVYTPSEKKEGVQYFQDLFGVDSKRCTQSLAGMVCCTLNVISIRELDLSHEYAYQARGKDSGEVFQPRKDKSKEILIMGGIIRAIDRYSRLEVLAETYPCDEVAVSRLADLAFDNITHILPKLEERTLFSRREIENSASRIFNIKELWSFVWQSYVLSLETLEKLGHGGVEDVGMYMRGWRHRDRSRVIAEDLKIKTPLSMIRRLYFCAKNGLCDPMTEKAVGLDDWKSVHLPWTFEWGELYLNPERWVDLSKEELLVRYGSVPKFLEAFPRPFLGLSNAELRSAL